MRAPLAAGAQGLLRALRSGSYSTRSPLAARVELAQTRTVGSNSFW